MPIYQAHVNYRLRVSSAKPIPIEVNLLNIQRAKSKGFRSPFTLVVSLKSFNLGGSKALLFQPHIGPIQFLSNRVSAFCCLFHLDSTHNGLFIRKLEAFA